MTLPSTSVSTAPACALFLATTAGLLLGASPAGAQEVGAQLPPRQTVSIVPRVSLTETATSNVQLTSAGNSDVVTELSPGIRINIEGAKLKAFVDYAVSEVAYKLPEIPLGATVLGFNYDTGERYLSVEGFLPA